MVLTKTSGLLLLQAAALLSGVAARCRDRPACAADDSLLVILRSADAAAPFCSDLLGLPASTVGATVTPTVVASVTETSYITEVVTEIDGTLIITVPAPITTSLAVVKRAPSTQSAAYPTWLPASYPAKRISSACSCLSIPLSLTTTTSTAEPATSTASLTATETTTSTLHSTALATATALPLITTRRAIIEILKKDTLASIGWLYNSNGLAIASVSNQAQAISVDFTLPLGATTGSQVRINLEGLTPSALAFVKSSNPTNIVELEDSYGTLATVNPTPPGSRPVSSGNDKYESDIWTVDTVSRMIGWQWIATNGSLPYIGVWKVGGRLYPVGDVPEFLYATGGTSASKFEVVFRYSLVAEL